MDKNNKISPLQRFFGWVRRQEGRVDSLLVVLSLIAVVLVVSTEMTSTHWIVPFFGYSWAHIQMTARTVIWLAFVLSFVVYCALSRRPLSYITHHVLELLVCVSWVPVYSEGSLHVLSELFVLSRFMPMDILHLIGTLAHAWRVVKSTGERFKTHPVFITGLAAVLLVCTAAALLQHVEPQTFPSFWDASWFALTTVTTIGFGDYVPKTMAGRLITSGLIISGISLAGIFIGLVSELVRNKLFAGTKLERVSLTDVQSELADTKEMVGRLESTQRQTNELLQQLLAEKAAQNPPPKQTP